jgi:lipoprotein-anchoring transpeptidase ErfK/SrfK
MRRDFVAACLPFCFAGAVAVVPASGAGAQTPLLDPGWQLAYPANQQDSRGGLFNGGFIRYTFGNSYGQPVVQRTYQPAPVYYQPVPAPRSRANQPAPQSYAVAPAQESGAYQQSAPQYYVAPAQQARAYQPEPQHYYTIAPAQQARGLLPPVYYQQQQTLPQYAEQGSAPQQMVARVDTGPAYAPSQYGNMARPMVDPKYDRQLVDYQGSEPPGTIVIDTPHFFLYLVLEDGKALRYGIGVGRPGFTWAGVKEVSAKRAWPDWRPPDDMLRRRPDLPRFMPGGPENPLGARAIYLGSTLYRIHGSNEPWTIGTQVSSGCIRLRNEDVIDLYGRVKVGSKVVVI